MESVVELQRQAHEEIERIEDAMARELARSAKTVRLRGVAACVGRH